MEQNNIQINKGNRITTKEVKQHRAGNKDDENNDKKERTVVPVVKKVQLWMRFNDEEEHMVFEADGDFINIHLKADDGFITFNDNLKGRKFTIRAKSKR